MVKPNLLDPGLQQVLPTLISGHTTRGMGSAGVRVVCMCVSVHVWACVRCVCVCAVCMCEGVHTCVRHCVCVCLHMRVCVFYVRTW